MWRRMPLLVATQLRNTAAIRLLLENKAEVDAANNNDITPLIAAAQTGNLEAASFICNSWQQNLAWT